ncbi:hypothetical protein R1flu_008670 [Riccia fluitans]|uniref:Uncharacterized protein n=1 Tax=Riccia fluitans TaxID=41844 RepID=A0ABD1YD04_9MARC
MVAKGSPMGANGLPMEANSLPARAKGRNGLGEFDQRRFGGPSQMVARNEACLVLLRSSRKMLSNDTKNTPSPFIDQKLCKFSQPNCQQAFANASEAIANAGNWFASGGQFPPRESDTRHFAVPRPNSS